MSAPAFGFPIFVEVRGRRVLVAGDGREAGAKADTLAGLGADVVRWIERDGHFDPALLDGAILAVVGTGDRGLDHRIASEARQRGVLVNTVDDIPFCDWSAPAILRRGELTLAIGTGGVAPALAVRLRDRIAEELIGDEYALLVELFADARPRIMASGRSFAERRRLWYELVDGPALDLLANGREAEARRVVDHAIAAWQEAAA